MDVDNWVRRARQGDREALELLCIHFHPQLCRFFVRMNLSSHDADDLAQSTLLRMMERLEAFHFLPGRRFEGWLFRIAYNLFIDLKRKPSVLPLTADLSPPDPSPSIEAIVARKEALETVRRAVSALDDEMQALISLRYELELSYADISAALNIPITRVRWRLHDALKKLKVILQEGGVDL